MVNTELIKEKKTLWDSIPDKKITVETLGKKEVCIGKNINTPEHTKYVGFCKQNDLCTKPSCAFWGFPYCYDHDCMMSIQRWEEILEKHGEVPLPRNYGLEDKK